MKIADQDIVKFEAGFLKSLGEILGPRFGVVSEPSERMMCKFEYETRNYLLFVREQNIVVEKIHAESTAPHDNYVIYDRRLSNPDTSPETAADAIKSFTL